MFSILGNWLQWGVHAQTDWTLKRKILHTHIAALIAIVLLAIYDTILLVLGSGVMVRIFLSELPF